MSYLVLARKYRPQKFSDLTGQETISAILKSAILQDRVAHAYLFSGPRGIGKTTTARIFAKALNCAKRSRDAEPCNACDSCNDIAKSNSLDVLELDAASHTQVDKIREVIIDSVAFAPIAGKYKIFIIDEVHMLSNHSFNALLKTLEEPPAHVVFILATTDFHKIPTTIASRCQRFRFLPLTPKEIVSNLKRIADIEKISAADDALAVLARSAAGAMRDALSLFDQIISSVSSEGKSAKVEKETVENILGLVKDDFLNQFLNQVADKNAKGVLESARRALNEGYDLSHFLKELRESYRQMLIHKCGYGGDDPYLDVRPGLPTDRFTKEKLLRDIQLLTRCAELMRWNDLPHVVFEAYAVRLCDDALSADEILERIKNLESSIQSGGSIKNTPAPASPPSIPSKASAPVMAKPFAPTAARESAVKPSVPAAPVASDEASSGIGGTWKKTLAILQQNKASLYTILQNALVQMRERKIEIAFYSTFALDAAKRSAGIIEEILNKESGQKITLILKLGNPENRPVQREEEETVVAADENSDAPGEGGETYDVLEPAQGGSPQLFAAEDAGVKKFLELFPGKIIAPGDPS